MGYQITADGTLRFPGDDLALHRAVVAIRPQCADAHTGEEALAALLGWDYVAEMSDGEYSVSTCSKGGPWIDKALEDAHTVGMRGQINFMGDGGDSWSVRLSDSGVHTSSAVTFYPDEPGEDADVVLLTRKQARAVLSLVAGDRVDGLDEVVARLTAALG